MHVGLLSQMVPPAQAERESRGWRQQVWWQHKLGIVTLQPIEGGQLSTPSAQLSQAVAHNLRCTELPLVQRWSWSR